VARLTGESSEVKVRRALVDATYLEPSVPATSAAPFEVEAGVRCVPVNELSRGAVRADRYVMIGAGKTAMDACVWLLQNGVPADALCWIKPREAWLLNRAFAQGGDLVGHLLDGIARQMEAAAQASSLEDLFARLNASEQLLRVDEHVAPTMYKGPTMSVRELELLRRVTSVVRLGAVRRIDRESVVLDRGALPAKSGDVYVHCAAAGLNPAPAVPIFAAGRITLQPIRAGLIPFNAAMVGYVEATRRDLSEKNRLCPPNRLPDVPLDWVRGTLIATSADYAWSKEADIAAWLERARLNPSRGLRQRTNQPLVRDAMARYAAQVRPGLANLTKLLAATEQP
jgi:hypothetical protein